MRRLCSLAAASAVLAVVGCGTAPSPSMFRADRTAGAVQADRAKDHLGLQIAGDGDVDDRFRAWEDQVIRFEARVQSAAPGPLTYQWETDFGHFWGATNQREARWAGFFDGWHEVTCTVTDSAGHKTSRTVDVIVWKRPGNDD